MAQAVRTPYTSVSDVEAFFQRVETLAEPKPSRAVDSDWVKSYGFETAHPSAIPSMLRWLGVIDEDGKSTGVWNDLRVDGKREETLQRLIRTAYEGIFDAVDVEQASLRDLRGAFVQVYSLGDPARQIKCFLALCQQAGIPTAVEANSRSQAGESRSTNSQQAKTKTQAPKKKPANPPARKPVSAVAASDSRRAVTTSDGTFIISLNVEIPSAWTEADIRERVASVARAVRAASAGDP